MSSRFSQLALDHLARWPLMQPQDFGKLAYQSEFGPEHLISDHTLARELLLTEYQELPADCPRLPPESIGGGLCRFHLHPSQLEQEGLFSLLVLFFLTTAQRHRGTMEGMQKKLDVLETLHIPNMGRWLEAYREEGCPPLHHSETFRKAYSPHYRVLSADYVSYLYVLLAVSTIVQSGKPGIVAIDGRCGSGKTGLARLIAQLFPCSVFHMDDFFLPFDKRTPQRLAQPGGNVDYERVLSEVLEPLSRGQDVVYRPFDCGTGGLLASRTVPFSPLTVLEGSYSHHPALAERYDLKLFLTCTQKEQRRRLLQREGTQGLSPFLERWIPLEEQYFSACHIEEESDLTVDTTGFFSLDESAFTV